MNLTDEQVIKALECCSKSNSNEEYCEDCPFKDTTGAYCMDLNIKSALDLINRKDKALKLSAKEIVDLKIKVKQQKAENKDLFYKLEGIMHSVDKWLEGDELKQDEVNRAATMREKTLQIMEQQKAEIDKLNIAFDVCKKEYDDMFEIAKNQKAEIERLQKEGLQINEIFMDLVNKQKMEAIKEFAERLKEKRWDADTRAGYVQVVDVGDIDNLVKEMVGDAE